MVSTRKTKEKFIEGDRVLCYEPDPTKAKVLYDSKVLEVHVGKDERGRRTTEYLIHFQGWNSSWDRVVNEDFVLKDTEENRQLQLSLAAKSRLQIGSYLYRKDQSEKEDATLSEKAFGAGNSCSSQDKNLEDEYLTETDNDSESSVDTDHSLEQEVPLELTPALRLRLENDFDRINMQHKLVKLPATPTIVEILESYIRHLANRPFRVEAEESARPRSRGQPPCLPHPINKADALEMVCARINLAKETVDGLRICFDFYLATQLLYAPEVSQYEQVKSGTGCLLVPKIEPKRVCLSEDDTSKSDDPFISGQCSSVQLTTEIGDQERRRSLRSHKDANAEPSTSSGGGGGSVLPANGGTKLTAKNLGILGNQNSLNNSADGGHSVSSTSSSYCGPLAGHASHAAGPLGPEMARLSLLASTWRLVPDSYLNQQPPPPSAVYGAVHLARLFVKLPAFIYAANLPEKENQPRHLPEHKLKLLLTHLQNFLSFLESHPEWFSAEHYHSKA